VIALVARAREVDAPVTVRVRELDDAAFDRAYGLRTPDVDDPSRLVHEHLREQALTGEAPPDQGVHATTAAAAYDRRDKTIWLRRSIGEDTDFIEAHEIAHALQDARFGLKRFEAGVADDALAARHAVMEGEAELTAFATEWEKKAKGARNAKRAGLTRVFDELAPLDLLESRVRVFGEGDHWVPSPQKTFLYREGLRFLAALYGAGGFALVDRAFTQPPISTSQILHPERYATATAPLAFDVPTWPAGVRADSTGSFGEARLVTWLSSVLPYPDARDTADGWAGDAYWIVRVDDGPPTLVLSIVMDRASYARRLEHAMRALSRTVVQRRGRRLGIVVGAPPSSANSLIAASYSAAERSPPAAEPIVLGGLPPQRRARVEAKAHRVLLFDATVVGEIPAGFRGHAGGRVPLVVSRDSSFGWVTLPGRSDLLDCRWNASTTPVHLSLGEGKVAAGRCEGVAALRYAVPACNGRKELGVVIGATDDHAQTDLIRWVHSFRAQPAESDWLARYCDR
jgi:hypothetical protein